ncbi:MAG: ShlB/FhaC/HecB family hemolysin secretion/activation protein [Prochloraceae cyanobacterium]|nr:ShlB/FhaC/HecB family hemolysin secretion/activation protein [Prochloraceae cyanobacterium]
MSNIKWCLRFFCSSQRIFFLIAIVLSSVFVEYQNKVVALEIKDQVNFERRPLAIAAESKESSIQLLEIQKEQETGNNEQPQVKKFLVQSRSTVTVNKIEVIGSTVFGPGDLDPIIEPFEGRSLTIEDLRQVADEISQLYLEKGYINSRAVPPADLDGIRAGVAQIQIVEGGLEEIVVEGTERLENYVRDRVELGAAKPLNIRTLEDQLRLLKADPLFENIEASLRPGQERGTTILVVRAKESFPFVGNVGFDNYSPPSIGGERFNLDLTYRNLGGIGDRISAFYRPALRAWGDTYELDFNYTAPVNAMNGTLQLDATIYRSKIIQDILEAFDITSEAERYRFTYRQPFIRTPREEFAISFGFVYKDGQTFTFQGPRPFGFGPDDDGISRTSVFELGQEYVLRQVSGAWGFRSLFRIGTGLFNATDNSDLIIEVPDGKFVSWLAQLQRVQIINEDNFFIIQLDSQLTPNSLLPAEQFAVGGGRSVRGYRENVRSGDNGVRFSVEDRFTVARNESEEPVFTLAPFFDLGYVWNDPNNPNLIPNNEQFIAGLGLGLLWEPVRGLDIRLDYAPPLIDLDDRGNNVQDDGFHFRVNYEF